ncbi:serine protease inhibitor 77Ba-like [Vanessa cardui]|uniref:serine protease inhibitor 77Ba-like n=1 Tax=Vanessa cardui TaxID=171605 RepID=UPI001F138069|nr:serine protease inhibitor 77Ba-like [Vanessa cardui]
MWILFIVFVITSCNAAEFSSRPTNVSLLLLHFTNEASKGPIVLAPFGLWSMMAAVSFGAHGDTKREIFRSFLLLTDRKKFSDQYKNLTDVLFQGNITGVEVSNRNYFFVDKNILIYPDFREILTDDYNSVFLTFDFQDPILSADRANSILRNTSKQKSYIFHSDDFKDSTIVMANVVFFKGYWSTPFNKSNTKSELVNSFDGKRGRVDMMHMSAKVRSSHMESMKATITELPYGNDGKYCMLLLFPDANVSIKDMYRNFERVTFRDIFNKLQRDEDEFGLKDVDVKLPHFVKRSKLQLHKPFNDMGIYDAFEPNNAAFGRISNEPIYIETVEHNVIVSVTESGTVAYGTTPGIIAKLPTVQENDVMPPFSFFIIEKSTATVIFGGIF